MVRSALLLYIPKPYEEKRISIKQKKRIRYTYNLNNKVKLVKLGHCSGTPKILATCFVTQLDVSPVCLVASEDLFYIELLSFHDFRTLKMKVILESESSILGILF